MGAAHPVDARETHGSTWRLSKPCWDPILGVGESQNSPPSLEFRTYFGGDWDVHFGVGVLTHGHILAKVALLTRNPLEGPFQGEEGSCRTPIRQAPCLRMEGKARCHLAGSKSQVSARATGRAVRGSPEAE